MIYCRCCIAIELTQVKGIDPTKSKNNKECIVCHCWFFNHGFKFQNFVCNVCHDLTMLRLNLSDIAIIIVKSVYCCCIIHGISKTNVIHLLENSVLDDCGHIQNAYEKNQYQKQSLQLFFNLIKAKKVET